jgi:autotransporter translocation and assembly factor TamB
MHVTVKAMTLGLLTLFALVVGLTMYTQTDGFRAWLRERIVVALREAAHGEIALGQVTGSVWSGLVFHNLSIRDATGEVLQVPQATVTFNLLSQIRLAIESATIRVTKISLRSPQLHLRQKPDSTWNVTHLFSSPPDTPPTRPLQFFIDHIHIDDGHIQVEPRGHKPITLQGVNADGKLARRLDTLKLDFSQLSFRAESPQLFPLVWLGGATYTHGDSTAALALHNVTLSSPESQLQLAGTVQNFDAPVFELTADVARVSATELRVLWPASPLQQDLTGRVQLHGSLQDLTAQANLQAPNGKVVATIKADLLQTPPHYEATADLDHVTIEKVARIADTRGEVSGRIEFVGSQPDTGTISFALQPSKLVVQDRSIGNGEITGTIVNKRITATGKTQGQIGQMQWNGWVELGAPLSYDGTVRVRECALVNITKKPLVIGETTINADVSVSGHGTTWQELLANAQVKLLPSRIGDVTDVRGVAVASFRQQQLMLESLSLTAQDTTVQIQGQLDDLASATPRATLSYYAQTQDVAPWLQRIGQPGHGALSLTGSVIGPLNQLTVTGSASSNNLRWQQVALHTGTVTYRLQAVGQSDAHGDITVAMQQLEAGGTWKDAAADVTVVRLQPLEIQTTLRIEGEQVRNLRAHIHARQTPAYWDVALRDLTLQLSEGLWTQARPTTLAVRTTQGVQVTVDQFTLRRGDHSISVSGTLDEQGQQNVHTQISQFPLAALRHFVPTLPSVGGDVSATLQLTGTLIAPEISAQITTSPLVVQGQTYAGLTGQGSYRVEKITLNAVLRQDVTHTLTLDGSLPFVFPWHGEFLDPQLEDADLRLRSAGINLALLGLTTGETVQDIEGLARIDLAFRGPLTALRPSGTVQLREGRARLETLDVTLKDIVAEVGVTAEFLDLRRFSLSAGKGEVTGSGRIALQQYTPGDMALTFVAKELRVINTRRYQGAVSGQITCSGSLTAPMIRGTLEAEDVTLRPAMSLLKSGLPPRDPSITVVQTEQDLTKATETEPLVKATEQTPEFSLTPKLLQRLLLDIAVKIPRDTWIHTADGSIELNGKLRVTKSQQQELTLNGGLETVRGWYAFHGRKFCLERGQVTFPGTVPIDPNIDVVARYTVAPYEVDVLLGGTARRPTLELRSNPMLEEADILSVLIFGKPANGLSGSEQVSLQTQAIQATAGYVASGLRRSIANKLGLDNLEFDMGQSIGQGKVSVGKYVTKDVYVSTSQQLGEKQEREVAVEYQLDRQWQLKGTTTSRGTSGVDVFWQKRY